MSRRRFAAATLAVGCIALWLSGDAPSSWAGAFEEAQARGRLLVGVRADYPPFAFIDGESRNAGFEIDIARFLALRLMGSENRLRLVPLAGTQRIDALMERRVDFVLASLATTEARRAQVLFSEPYYASGVGLLARKEAPLKAWSDLRQRKVCAIEGAGYDEQLAGLGIDQLRFPTTPAAFKALRDGACEGLAYDDSALAARLADPEWGADYHLPLPPLAVVPWAIGLRRDDLPLKQLIDPILQEMEASGFIVALEAKWRLPFSAFARDRMAKGRKPPGR
jgi:polar amino acid transport system substrate-binding protein